MMPFQKHPSCPASGRASTIWRVEKRQSVRWPRPSPLPDRETSGGAVAKNYSGVCFCGLGRGTTVCPGVTGKSRVSGALRGSPLAFHQVEA